MSVSVISKFVAIVSLWTMYLVTTPAAAQRVIRGYADEDFQNQALAASGYRQQRYEPIRSNEAQKITVAASWNP